jgi:hypothetical protein
MRIALIDPPQQAFLGYYRFYFPLGLVSVGSMLEAQDHEVAIFDLEHLPEGRCLSNAEASKLFSHYYESVHNLGHPIWTRLAVLGRQGLRIADRLFVRSAVKPTFLRQAHPRV